MNSQGPAPQVSIVMATYCGERFLRAQMDSILAQSFGDFELLVVDDVSSDRSYEMVQDYARRDRRIVVTRNERNLGLLGNLAALFGQARAPWIAVSDHDDVWHPHKLETLLRCAGGRAAAYCNSDLIDGQGQPLGTTIMEAIGVARPAQGHDPLALLWKNCVSAHAMIFRRELCPEILPFSTQLPYDQQIAILAMANGGLAYCPETLVQHRLHDSNLCNHSLLAKVPSKDAAAPRKLGDKLLRRRQHRRKLADRIFFFENKKLIPAKWGHIVNSDRLDQRWFDLGMFRFVLQHPELFAQRTRHRPLRVAFKFAKGAAWYRTVAAWRFMLSGSPGRDASR